MATLTQKKPGRKQYNCPVEAALDVIGGKWKIVILCWLKQGTHRFGELRRQIPGISERMLTQHLRELERDGIVHRKAYPEVPPKVEYSLTPFGDTLRPIMVMLNKWGETHMKRIENR
jgi:DNA-binding HxlR family transcriptional regulator